MSGSRQTGPVQPVARTIVSRDNPGPGNQRLTPGGPFNTLEEKMEREAEAAAEYCGTDLVEKRVLEEQQITQETGCGTSVWQGLK